MKMMLIDRKSSFIYTLLTKLVESPRSLGREQSHGTRASLRSLSAAAGARLGRGRGRRRGGGLQRGHGAAGPLHQHVLRHLRGREVVLQQRLGEVAVHLVRLGLAVCVVRQPVQV